MPNLPKVHRPAWAQATKPRKVKTGGTRWPTLYGRRWRKARINYLTLHPLCVFCQREGSVNAATEVDHVIPHKGDAALFWDERNWQSLCSTCHRSVKQRLEQAHGYK